MAQSHVRSSLTENYLTLKNTKADLILRLYCDAKCHRCAERARLYRGND